MVTASGLASSGSLRAVRSGIASDVIAKLEGLEGIVSIASFETGSG